MFSDSILFKSSLLVGCLCYKAGRGKWALSHCYPGGKTRFSPWPLWAPRSMVSHYCWVKVGDQTPSQDSTSTSWLGEKEAPWCCSTWPLIMVMGPHFFQGVSLEYNSYYLNTYCLVRLSVSWLFVERTDFGKTFFCLCPLVLPGCQLLQHPVWDKKEKKPRKFTPMSFLGSLGP